MTLVSAARRWPSARTVVPALLASAVLGFAFGPPGEARGDGDGRGPLPPLPVCKHAGTEWESPRLVASGSQQCTSVEFELSIGVDQLGAAVVIQFNGCPSSITIKPGRFKKIQKLHHNAVNPQQVPWMTVKYDADCGGVFSNPSCTETTSTEAGLSSTTWEEEGCDRLG